MTRPVDALERSPEFKFTGPRGRNFLSAALYCRHDGSRVLVVWIGTHEFKTVIERPASSWTGAGQWRW